MQITGDDFKAARCRLGESQTIFAGRFGVDQATISRWETVGPPERGIAAKLIKRVLSELHAEARA